MKLKEVKQRDLKTGDQIAVRGNVKDLDPSLLAFTAHTGGTYLHHGIYSEEGCKVIDFHGDDKENARPKERDFEEFYDGHDKLYRVEYEDGENCLPVKETMQRAKEAVERGNSWPAYHLIENNCETFATLLKTGEAVSMQVLKALARLAAPLSLLLVIGSAFLVAIIASVCYHCIKH